MATQEVVLTNLSVRVRKCKAYAGFQKRGFALSDRLDAVGHRRALERHDVMEAARRADANQRIKAKHTRDHGADVDPPSA